MTLCIEMVFMLPLTNSDLKKFRSYQGNSVKDLLRAMRNKVSKWEQVKRGGGLGCDVSVRQQKQCSYSNIGDHATQGPATCAAVFTGTAGQRIAVQAIS